MIKHLMAEVKMLFNLTPARKLRASSILEVVVAMVITVTVLGIALAIYSNVVRSSLSARQLQAQALLSKRMEILAHSADTAQTDSLSEGWHLRQQVQPYQGNAQLEQVHLALLDDNQDTIAQLLQIIIARPGKNPTPNGSTTAH